MATDQQNKVVSDLAVRINKGEIRDTGILKNRPDYRSLTEDQKRALLTLLQNKSNVKKAAKESSSSFDDFVPAAIDNIGTLIGGYSELQVAIGGTTKAFGDMVEDLKDTDKGSKDVGKTIGNFLVTTLNKLTSVLSNTITKIEKYRIGLEKAGVIESRKFLLSLREQQDQLLEYGITMDKLTTTVGEFRTDLASLVDKQFPSQEKQLIKIAAVNDRFGIGLQTSTSFLNIMDTQFQMSSNSAEDFNNKLLNFAKQTGQPFNKIFAKFTQSVSAFNVEMDPNKALQKFTVFQQMARRLGKDISTLTDLTDKFDTIEGGMEFGGNLNMLLSNLGGSFNAVEATLMEQPERMEYIANQVAEVGDKIRGMSDLGQRAILKQLAQTLGVDVAMVRSLIDKDKGADISRFLQGTTDLSAMREDDIQKLAGSMTSRADMLKQENDMLIGKVTVAAEKTAHSVQELNRSINRTIVDLLGKSGRLNKLVEDTLGAAEKNAKEFKTALDKSHGELVAQLQNVTFKGEIALKADSATGGGSVEIKGKPKPAAKDLNGRGG